VATVLSAIE